MNESRIKSQKDAQQDAKAQKQAEAVFQEEARRVRILMGTPESRAAMLELIYAKCGVLTISYVQKDSLATAYNDGRRSVGLEFLALIETHAPDLHLLARREHMDKTQPQDTMPKTLQRHVSEENYE